MYRYCLSFLCLALILFPNQLNGSSASEVHPYYVSIYQIDYSEQHRTVQITAKIFTDDLEKGLIEAGYPKTKLATKEELPKTDTYIEDWLRDHFAIQLDGSPEKWTYLGKEAEINATWIYMEISEVDKPSRVTVRNSALLDLFDTQTNMTHVDLGGEVKTLLLRNTNIEGTVTFP